MKPLAIDLFCGLGGWAEGFLSEGYDVIGFDIERHNYGTGGYPGQLVLQDVLALDGRQFRNAAVIVASPPCQGYSYRAMPWKRAKALPPPDNTLFEACFRIAKEAGVPIVVENVRGAEKWVGPAQWHFGSYYLWGDVPALMPTIRQLKRADRNFHHFEKTGESSPSFNGAAMEDRHLKTVGIANIRDGYSHTRHLTNQRESDGAKQHGSAASWFDSRSTSRKAASAQIAKIPFPLSSWIARCFKP